MSYYVNKTDGTAIVVLDGTKDTTSTSLTLIGKLSTTYGEFQNENFVHLLENFALSTSPPYPITGQLWYDTSSNNIKSYNGTSWAIVGSDIVGNVSLTGNLFIGPNGFQIQDLGDVAITNKVSGGDISLYANIAGTNTRTLYINGGSGLVEVAANAAADYGVTTKIYVDKLTSDLSATLASNVDSLNSNLNSLNSNVNSLTSNVDSLTSTVTSGTGILNAQKLNLNGNTALSNSGSGNTVVNFSTPDGFTIISAQGSDALNTSVTFSGQWNLGVGASINANYADLAEYYSSDYEYEPGTVVVFGGEKEVTVTSTVNDTRLAGVVSTNPAYTMNNDLSGERVCLALEGRTPCKTIGPVRKGDLLTTADSPGYATVAILPKLGAILGKSLEDNHTVGPCLVEISVSRA